MKFNWGTGITIVLIAFAIGMGYAVYKAVQQDYDLVTSDYYTEELAYQDRIDEQRNALRLGEPVTLTLSEAGLLLKMPESLKGQQADAHLEMYCVTEADNDFSMEKADWTVADLAIPASRLKSGKWVAKLTLMVNDTGYYFDPEILIP